MRGVASFLWRTYFVFPASPSNRAQVQDATRCCGAMDPAKPIAILRSVHVKKSIVVCLAPKHHDLGPQGSSRGPLLVYQRKRTASLLTPKDNMLWGLTLWQTSSFNAMCLFNLERVGTGRPEKNDDVVRCLSVSVCGGHPPLSRPRFPLRAQRLKLKDRGQPHRGDWRRCSRPQLWWGHQYVPGHRPAALRHLA